MLTKTRQDKTRQDKTRQTDYGFLKFVFVKLLSSFVIPLKKGIQAFFLNGSPIPLEARLTSGGGSGMTRSSSRGVYPEQIHCVHCKLHECARTVISILLIFSLLLTTSYLLPTTASAASSPWTQTDWSGGSGQTAWSDTTKFDSSSSVTTSTAGQATLTNTEKLSNTGFETDTTSWTAAAVNLPTNLTSYWKLTESSGSRADSVGSNTLTDNNTVTGASGGPPPPDGAWSQFTRANIEWLSVTSNADLQIGGISFTSCYWMYLDSGGQWRTMISKWEGSVGKNEWSNNINNTPAVVFYTSQDGTNIGVNFASSITLSTGQWYFVCTGYDLPNTQYFIQINNGTPTTNTSASTIYNGTGTLAIGEEHNRGTTFAFDGRIASMGLWRRLLTTAERTTLYNSGSGLAYPFYTLTRDTSTTYSSSAGSAKIVAGDATNLTQSVNVGDTNTYALTAYAYTTGAAVTSSDVSLFYNGSTVSTTYTSVGSGWYQLTGTVTGVASSVGAGVQVAAGKTVYLDNFSLNNYASSGTLTSSIFDSGQGSNWGTLTYTATTPTNTTVTVKTRTSNDSAMSGATAFSSCNAITSGSDISSNNCVTDTHRYIQYQLTLANSSTEVTPTFSDITITFEVSDADAPSISLTALSPDPNTDSTPTISGTVTEETGTVSNVQLQMDATSGSWTACTATDGSFNSATETFSCTPSALSDGSHTIYVRATDSNSNTTSNASASTDTFTIDVTAPASFDLDSPGHESYTTNERPTFKWKATTDATSGLSSYTLEVDNGASGDFSITGIPTSRTTDYEVSKYLIHYDGFSDSDSTNNYISIYTKSSSSWGSGENDGKLKEGLVGWKIKAIDAAGNERSEGRTLIVDLTSPTLSSVSVADSLGTKDSYEILTDTTPAITGTIADTYYPDKVELSFYKESYFLGILTSTTLISTQSQSQSLSNTSKTSLAFSVAAAQSLDYGSYQVTVKGTDKAGNSTSTTLYFKILTSEEAQKILKGKLSEEEKKTIQENAKVSLPALEKKAKLRREKEAGELNKFLTDLKSMGNGLESTFSVIASEAKQSLTGISNQIASSVNFLAMTTRDAIELRLAQLSRMTGEGIKIAASSASGVLLRVTNTISQATPEIIKDTTALVMVKPFEGVNKQLAESEEKIKVQIDRNVKTQMSNVKSAAQILKVAGKGIQGGLAAVDLALDQSQERVKREITIEFKDQNTKIKTVTEKVTTAAGLAMKSFEEPASKTTDFLHRTQVAFDTARVIMFDPNPTKILGVYVEEVGKDFVVISWDTNHYTKNNKVNYGEDLKYGQSIWSKNYAKKHTVKITGLKPGKRYLFEVMSDGKNYVYDAFYSFETEK